MSVNSKPLFCVKRGFFTLHNFQGGDIFNVCVCVYTWRCVSCWFWSWRVGGGGGWQGGGGVGTCLPFFTLSLKEICCVAMATCAHTETERAGADGLIWPDRDASASWSLRAARCSLTGNWSILHAPQSHPHAFSKSACWYFLISCNSFQLSVNPSSFQVRKLTHS